VRSAAAVALPFESFVAAAKRVAGLRFGFRGALDWPAAVLGRAAARPSAVGPAARCPLAWSRRRAAASSPRSSRIAAAEHCRGCRMGARRPVLYQADKGLGVLD